MKYDFDEQIDRRNTNSAKFDEMDALFGSDVMHLGCLLYTSMFQKYAKINYRDYVQNVRLERASKELMETDHMISDIALNHGFANSKAFANAFRKKYGRLPSDFRKEKN